MLITLRAAHTAAAAVLVALLACAPTHQFQGDPVEDGVPLQLVGTNWNGESFDLDEFRGKVVVVFFGYTYCPDICPMTLAKMSQLEGQIGDSAGDLEVVFASVDPHRDSVEKLSQYVPNFGPDFYGLHLDFDQIDLAKESFGLAVQYGQPKDGPGSDSYYYVDHTGSYFVVDREGDLRVTFPPNTTVDFMLPDVRYLLEG